MRWLLKRWWFWAWTVFVLIALAAGYLLIPIKEDRLSRATYDKIQLGMTVVQVKELTGLGRKFDKILDVNWGDEGVLLQEGLLHAPNLARAPGPPASAVHRG